MEKIMTVAMPDIGEGVVEGEVIQWLKHVGDPVLQDEPVVVVMTDKATVELPSPYAGVMGKQYYQEGEISIVGKPLYDIEVQKVLATPATRRLAKEMGVDLSRVTPTGKEGRVTKEDLIPEGDTVMPLTGIPRLMAKNMTDSHREVADFSYFEQVDATRLIALKNKVKEEAAKEGVLVTYMPFFIRALSLTLSAYPLVNSSLTGEKLILHEGHNIGIATATGQGLVVPVLKGVEKMHLQEVIRGYEELKNKAQRGRLEPGDFQGGTITISNFGPLSSGGFWATPVIRHPEAAILAVAKIHKQPVVVNNEIVIREMLNLSWTFDHRIVDGHLAAQFSRIFAGLLANPAGLL